MVYYIPYYGYAGSTSSTVLGGSGDIQDPEMKDPYVLTPPPHKGPLGGFLLDLSWRVGGLSK